MRCRTLLPTALLLALVGCEVERPNVQIEKCLAYDGATEFDLYVGEHRTIPLNVVFKSKGAADVSFVRTGCTCRHATIEPKSLSPGEQAIINLQLHGKHGMASTTEFAVEAMLRTEQLFR